MAAVLLQPRDDDAIVGALRASLADGRGNATPSLVVAGQAGGSVPRRRADRGAR
ncbi:hypothetical protein LCL61_27160 [Amycolatopsis coloradensis]|uniref:Uncharacterized protein n=1 Tax=Amycolatopsis coloradensis TaxID=76021 RepID=A0ACD5BIL6_9PSEU